MSEVWLEPVFGVPSGDLLFVAPEMVVHYVEKHGYSPPAGFVDAVLRSPLPDTEEYRLIAKPFWHKHRLAAEAAKALHKNRGMRWLWESWWFNLGMWILLFALVAGFLYIRGF